MGDRYVRGWDDIEGYNMSVHSYIRAAPWFCSNDTVPQNATYVPYDEVKAFIVAQTALNQTAKSDVRSLSTIAPKELAERFIFGWALAKVFTSVIGLAGTLFGTSCSIYSAFGGQIGSTTKKACAFAGIIGILTGGYSVMDSIRGARAASVSSDMFQEMFITNYAERLGDSSSGIGNLGNPFRKRDELHAALRNVTTAGNVYQLHHHETGELHNVLDILSGNRSHPLLAKVSGPHYKDWALSPTLRIWHQAHPTKENRTLTVVSHYNEATEKIVRRQLTCAGAEGVPVYASPVFTNDAQGDELDRCSQIQGSSSPDQMYYGFDLYDTSSVPELESHVGDKYAESNGLQPLAAKIADQGNVWDACICNQENGVWESTGSVQYSWDETYNGYSQCWNQGCDNA